ncbi:MAG: DUF3306 domain-containing protein [Hyphomicrobiales bacterium]|nr:DUF3306 domain-containing protein [Hyphomicrobiales bacterium]
MTEPENFLARWSRRKRVAEEPPADAVPPDSPEPIEGKKAADGTHLGAANETATPPFDPASLPSIDSIGAQTDITAFLKPGVPGDLRLAALRRAWVTDPAIRDFKGLAENDWDFTVPNSTMGFGEIDPGLDIKKMLADVFGDTPRAKPPEAEGPAAADQLTPPPKELPQPSDRAALNAPDSSAVAAKPGEKISQTPSADDEMVRSNNNIALQNNGDAADDEPIKRRRPQGGALPR